MDKLYDRIIWKNNQTPALNETNLNAMSKGLADIDDRVVELAGQILEVVPQIQIYLEQAEDLVEAMEMLSKHPPYIGANGNWYVWDTETSQFVDSGIDASITVSIADITMIATDQAPYVTNSGTNTDPVFHLYIPIGNGIASIAKTGTSVLTDTYTITYTNGNTTTFTVVNGNGIASIAKTGTSGLVDTYTITFDNGNTETFDVTNGNGIASIAKTGTSGLTDTYTITFTDGNTTTFTVTNGAGDMSKADYDPQGTVENAGGIPAYAAKKPQVKTATLTAGSTTVTFTQLPTTGNHIITFATSNGINYTAIDTSTPGEAELTFDAQSSNIDVYCRIEEVV